MDTELKETHMQGFLSVEKPFNSTSNCDFGIQVSASGKVWICINGEAFIRFTPNRNSYEHARIT